MNKKPFKMSINNYGQVLLFVVVLMTVALSVGVSISTRTLSSLSRVTKEDTSNKATAAAESGIETILLKSKEELDDLALSGETTKVQFKDAVTNIDTVAEIKVEKYTNNFRDNGVKFNLENGFTKEIKIYGYSGSLKICWDNTASALTHLIYDNSGIISKGIDVSSNYNSTNIGGATQSSMDPSINEATAGCVNVNIPNDTSLGLRLRSFYQNTNVFIFPEAGKNLPEQGYKITAKGKLVSEGKVVTTKNITVYRSDPYISSIFDDALYIENNLYD